MKSDVKFAMVCKNAVYYSIFGQSQLYTQQYYGEE